MDVLGTQQAQRYTNQLAAYPLGVAGGTVGLGDSTMRGGDDPTTPYYHQESWLTYGCMLTQGRLRVLQNAGVNGDMASGGLARFDTDVTPYAPSVVIIAFGVNDAEAAVTIATFSANMVAIFKKCRNIGAVPVLTTVVPDSAGGTTSLNLLRTYNLWLRRYAAKYRLPLLDFERILADPSGAGYVTGYTGDNRHPNTYARGLMAAEMAVSLASYLVPQAPGLGYASGETSNLLAGSAFSNDSNSDGIADSWLNTGGTGAGITQTVVGPVVSDQIVGKWQRTALTVADNTERGVSQVISTGWSVGDKVAFIGKARWGGVTGTGGIFIYLQCTGGAYNIYAVKALTQPMPNGVFYIEATIPASTSALTARVVGVNSATATGTLTLDVADVAVRNLTTLALGV